MTALLLSLLKGIPTTVGISCCAFLLGMIVAVPLVLMRRSRPLVLWLPARVYIDIVRGVPPIVWLFILFFGLGSGVFVLDSWQAAVVGMGMVSSAYLAEIYRGGFLALSSGQEEAATALGMSKMDTLRDVLLPQVLRVCVPPMATFFVSLLKDTTVASTIGVRDVLMVASQHAQSGGGSFTPFILAAILYIILSIPVAMFARVMDAKLRAQGQAR